MKPAGLILTLILVLGLRAIGQSIVTQGNFYQTISADVPGQPGNSQVSSMFVRTATWVSAYETFDNSTATIPYFVRGGGNPEFIWTYNAGPEVRGYLTYATGGHLNHPFANLDNPDQSTRIVFTIAPHSVPKIRANQTQLIVPVTFTFTGQIAVFAALGPGAAPDGFELMTGQGSGTLIYRRRGAEYFTKAWRQTPQARLFLANINLTFSPPQ